MRNLLGFRAGAVGLTAAAAVLAFVLTGVSLAASSIFQPAATYYVDSQPVALALGDFNRNGSLDIAVLIHGASNVQVLLGKGDGTFEEVPSGPKPRATRARG